MKAIWIFLNCVPVWGPQVVGHIALGCKHAATIACLVFAYPDIHYPDLSVNFMAAKNPDILK